MMREQTQGELTLHSGRILRTSIPIFGRIELKMNAMGLIVMKPHTNRTISLLWDLNDACVHVCELTNAMFE